MGIITISREMGSLGSLIGEKVAEKLNMKCVSKELITQIMKEYGFAKYQEIYEQVPTFWERYDELRLETLQFLSKTIEALGHHDNIVIVGRGGYEIFENFSDVLNVRTTAPFDIRVQRKKEEHDSTEEEAIESIIHHDKVRKSFLDGVHKADCETSIFDLVINTGCVLPDVATEVIVSAYKTLMENGRNKNSKQLKDLKIDPVLEDLVKKSIAEL